jgi:hypothetical protein
VGNQERMRCNSEGSSEESFIEVCEMVEDPQED